MKFLIAQGPGYYGVNIRIIPDEVATEIVESFNRRRRPKGSEPFHAVSDDPVVLTGIYGDATVLMIAEAPMISDHGSIDSDKSSGFDTGWWHEGEEAIEAVLKPDPEDEVPPGPLPKVSIAVSKPSVSVFFSNDDTKASIAAEQAAIQAGGEFVGGGTFLPDGTRDRQFEFHSMQEVNQFIITLKQRAEVTEE